MPREACHQDLGTDGARAPNIEALLEWLPLHVDTTVGVGDGDGRRTRVVVLRPAQGADMFEAVSVVDIHPGCGSRPALDSHPGGSRGLVDACWSWRDFAWRRQFG